MVRAVILILASATFLLAPGAHAQTAPTSALTLAGLPSGTIPTNETIFPELFDVTLRLERILCPRAADFVVSLATEVVARADGNGSVGFAFTPAAATFHVDAGEYVTTPYTRTIPVQLNVAPGVIPYGGLEVPVNLTASLPGQNQGCQANGNVPAQAPTASFTVLFQRATEPAPPPEPQPEMPGPGVLLTGIALVGVLWGRRGLRD